MALAEQLELQGSKLFRYRGIIPLAIIAAGLAVYLHHIVHPGIVLVHGTPIFLVFTWVCLFISLSGLAIRVYTVGFTPRKTSGRNVDKQIADTLNVTGIYSVVRHPLYLGNFFMWLGPVLLSGNPWFVIVVCLFYWLYYERIMFTEEQFLRRKFGETFLDWAAKTPAFLPSFRNYAKTGLPFSWKKALKKEKNGLAAVFIIFTVMNITGELVSGERNFDYILIACCVFTGIAYLVLKFLKRKTSLLDEVGR